MAAQAVSGPVLGLILALFWTLRNRENRCFVCFYSVCFIVICHFLWFQIPTFVHGAPHGGPNRFAF